MTARRAALRLIAGPLALTAGALAQSADEEAGNAGRAVPAILGGGADVPFLPDFSYAGYGYGLRDIPGPSGEVVDVADHGAVPDDGKDDSEALLAALDAAHAAQGPVTLRFGAGRYRVTEILKVTRSDIVLAGMGRGAGGTELHFPRPLSEVGDGGKLDELRAYLEKYDKRQREPENNIDELFSEYSWSGGFLWIGPEGFRPAAYLERYDERPRRLARVREGSRGGRTLTLSKASDLSPGDRIQVLWYNQTGRDAPILEQIYGETDLEIGSHHWSFKTRPIVRQYTTVEAVDGAVVTLASELMHHAGGEVPAEIAPWTPLTHVGIEDMAITFPPGPDYWHHGELGYNGIYLTGTADSWVRNVRITEADSGILTYANANVTLSDIVTDGDRVAHYGVHMGEGHNILARNIKVMNPARHSLSANTKATRIVYQNAEVFRSAVIDQHAGSNHQNLFDNITLHVAANRREDGEEGPSYPLWDGSGAGYWQPGHGAFNTFWNVRVLVQGGALPGETVTLQGLAEGPSATIVGVYGNRPFALDYRPAPYVERLNERMQDVPSLYEYQLARRREASQPGSEARDTARGE